MLVGMLDLEISPDALAALLSTGPKPVLLDVREPWEFETARLEDAILMPMGEIPGRAHQELDPEAHIVTVCHHGVRSLNVAAWLRNQGFDRAQSLAGGMDGWSRSIDPSIARY